MAQTSLIVRDNMGEAELNRMLEKGWKVINMCGMPSSCSISTTKYHYVSVEKTEFQPACLVILEKV